MPKDSVSVQAARSARMADLFDRYFRTAAASVREISPTADASVPVLDLPTISPEEISVGVRMIELAEMTGLDLYSIYCTKTGQPVGTRAPRTIEIMCAMYNVADIAALWPYVAQTSIAPQWLRTDATALDALIEHDPCGYFVYALSTIWLHVQPGYASDKNFWTDPVRARAFVMEKAGAYARACKLPVASIRECNEMLVDFLRLISPRTMRHKLRLPCVDTMADLVTAEAIAELPGTLARIAYHVLTTARVTNLQANTGIRLSNITTIADIAAFQDALGAKNTAFAGQKRVRRTGNPDASKNVREAKALIETFGVRFKILDARETTYAAQAAVDPNMAGRVQRYSGIARTFNTTALLNQVAAETIAVPAEPAPDASAPKLSFLQMIARASNGGTN